MAREFKFAIMVCSGHAKLAAYEASGYLFTLLSEKGEYKGKTPVWANLRTLLSLLIPAPPWGGPPLSHAFGITWGTVKQLLTGAVGIASIKLKGPRT